MLWARQPIEEAVESPEIEAESRALLQLVTLVRRFAVELGLDVGEQYTTYVAWPGDRIVTTLVRTRPHSVEAVPYWFPIVGRLPYKGYFDRVRAESEAERLREDGPYEVCVSGVAAYSTLGWLNDPVTTPMLRSGPESLVETILHELVHATVFLADDVEFNESIAQFVGQEAAVRFFATQPREPSPDAMRLPLVWPEPERVRASIDDRRAIALATTAFREELVNLEGDPDYENKRAAAEGRVRQELAALPLHVIDAVAVAARARLSNACLALRGTYIRDLPRHAEFLDALGGDLPALIERLVRIENGELKAQEFHDLDRARTERDETRSVGSTSHEFDDTLLDQSSKDL
jgi:predicted aminopeptidase